ncbi:glycolipid 2-alpha-mannosyltransferase [Lophiotrema nucula]|uniref:Glycolipid 2-alpha-mannosyltransferase n=1 Tax=Lophiotrema nucula TaxID=690887 RepID=A0A6A5YKI9_9PLEO|nr:glycolipid 2-alpha-mannosyltransferase [Lophiotrema nucula]
MIRLYLWRSTRWRLVLVILLGLILELLLHQYYYHVPRPSQHHDPPFQIGCKEPRTDAPRENATIVMLAQNADLEQALVSIQSLEDHFNRWFHYPVTFLNDQPWSEEFISRMRKAVSGETIFEVVPSEMFGYPGWMDREDAKQSGLVQEANGIHKGGLESYHHMCRFYSGKFYDVEALKSYRWYWRVEPHVQFTCSVTYDPFVEMAKTGKKYGYTVALWELDSTVPSLFRAVSDYKAEKRIKTTALWKSMIRPSRIPWPLRKIWRFKQLHDASGDEWNLCHFWSNFEIADMDFFRSQEHRDFFEYLDRKGGFYFERWGDASIHAWAAALLLQPHELHYFQDFGYFHDPWRVAPANAKGGQLPDSKALSGRGKEWAEESQNGVGCRCEHREIRNFQNWCFNKVQRATHPTPWPNKIGWQ